MPTNNNSCLHNNIRTTLSERLRTSNAIRGASLLAASICACYAPSTLAQRTATAMEEVIVTVRRRVEMEQEVPISLKAMDSDYLRQQNIVELNDLATKIPAVSISTNTASTNEPLVAIRGQRPTDVSLTLDQAAPMYFNEVVMTPTVGTNLAMYDLQSVQVLKGPQGTLFGRNSTGGAILITPQRPGIELGGYAEVTLGNYDLFSLEGAVDVPVSDSVQFRLAGKTTDRDGYQKNVADNGLKGEDFWDEDSNSIRLTVNADIGDLNNLAVLSYDENDMRARNVKIQVFNGASTIGSLWGIFYNGAFGGPNNIDDTIERQANQDAADIETDMLSFEKIENTFFSNTTELELTDSLSLKNVFGYRKVDVEKATDGDGTAFPLIGAWTSSTSTITHNPAPTLVDAEQYSNELQLIGDSFDGDLEWLAGVYWYQMKGSSENKTQQLGPVVGWTPIGVPSLDGVAAVGIFQQSPYGDVDNEALGIFAEGTYTFNDRWAATVGLRYSYDERAFTAKNTLMGSCNVRDEAGVPLANDNCSRKVSEEFEAPTWRASVNYTPTDGMLIYGSIATGYRAGGFNMRGTDNLTLTPFDEETVLTYEIGHKTDWNLVSDLPLRTNIAAYYQEYSDIQKTQSAVATDGTFGTATINAAEATISGVEFDVTWLATNNLLITVGYSYIDTIYDEWTDLKPWGPGGSLIEVDQSDGNFTYIPRNTATLSATYNLPLDPSLGEVSVTASGYWQDEMDTHATAHLFDLQQSLVGGFTPDALEASKAAAIEEGYDVWNLRVDWRDVMGTNFDAAIYSTNITDEEYVVGGLNVPVLLGITARTYGPPRTVGASLRYSF